MLNNNPIMIDIKYFYKFFLYKIYSKFRKKI